MRHTYECPMRWADLDPLGHVNNVSYVDYLQEARVDLLRLNARGPQTDGLVEGVVVVSHQIHYLRPLLFDLTPVMIEVWVTEIRAASFTLAYEAYQERDGVRVAYLRATTVLAPYVFATETPRRLTAGERASLIDYLEPAQTPLPGYSGPRRLDLGRYALHTRFSDIDTYGHVNNVKYFEYFQVARISTLRHVRVGGTGTVGSAGNPSLVAAQADVSYVRPILFRQKAYDVYSWVVRVGTRSMLMEAEILDGAQVLARGRFAMVFFDAETGHSIEPPATLRDALAKLI